MREAMQDKDIRLDCWNRKRDYTLPSHLARWLSLSLILTPAGIETAL